MIIGTGLLGKAFCNYETNLSVCVYAQGVSNSNCVDINEYQRDYNLVKQSIEKYCDKKFVYFSSCSILDSNSINNLYVQHKIKIENLIKKYHSNYLIIRLPQVAGFSKNSTLLLNYFYNNIKNDIKFNIWKKSKRNIIDVEDVVDIVGKISLCDEYKNSTLNVANKYNYSLLEIINHFENIIGKLAIYEFIDRESEYDIPIDSIENVVGNRFDGEYLKNLLEKYYGNR